MVLTFDERLTAGYKNASQKARVLTEHWVDSYIYCPNCGRLDIDKYQNNRPVADFLCANCQEDYELKSKQNFIGSKIVDGAYQTMLKRLQSSRNPNFFLLSYDLRNLSVLNFLVIPKHFFIPEIIEKRKPLTSTAQRAGWVGCNVLLRNIPQSGKVFYVKDSVVQPKEKVLRDWQKTLFLREEKETSARGWLLDIMRCVEKLGKSKFTLDEVYAFEKELSILHPNNRHIKDKIRQQLQILRDRGYLDFVSRGYYCIN